MALERARREVRPTVLETDTYRYYGASIADANHRKYRTHEEIEERKARDPLMLGRRHLIEHGVTSDSGVELILAEVMVEIAKALEFAESGALPGVADISGNVYWETDHATHASGIGSHFFND